MFNNKRYITRRIVEEIPIELQSYLWNLIDTMEVTEKDYFQVFQINNINSTTLAIKHFQECPEYCCNHTIANCFSVPVNIKLYVIDSSTYSTMLFAEEY